MSETNTIRSVSKSKQSLLLPAFLILLLLLVTWHFVLPLTALAALTLASVSGVLIIAIVLMSVALLVFYLLKGTMMLVFGGVTLLAAIIGIVLFPFLFPILMPLAFVMACIGLLRR